VVRSGVGDVFVYSVFWMMVIGRCLPLGWI
jgi:hypothetical protein